jgi:hypothetical protein
MPKPEHQRHRAGEVLAVTTLPSLEVRRRQAAGGRRRLVVGEAAERRSHVSIATTAP